MLISEALQGKFYRSSSVAHKNGIIKYATKRNDVYTKDNVYAYAIQVRPIYDPVDGLKSDFYATIYVGVDE
jgi:hypothetical protein